MPHQKISRLVGGGSDATAELRDAALRFLANILSTLADRLEQKREEDT